MSAGPPRLLGAGRLLALVALVAALAWSGLLASAHLDARATVLDRLESSLLDLRILAFGRRPVPPDVVIAAIDDDAVRAAKAFPIPRKMLGDAVGTLLEGGARAVVLDALFLDPGAPDGDAALAAALGSGPTVIAAMLDYAADGASTCVLPVAGVGRATVAGEANIALDRSGIARHVPMLLACGRGVLPALALRGVSLAAAAEPAFTRDAVEVGGTATPLDVGRDLALRYYGPEGTVPTVSLAGILDGRVRPDVARDRIVLVGATAKGVGDRYASPFDPVLPGVEIMATAVANLATGDALVRTTLVRRVDAGVAVGLAVAGAACLLLPSTSLGLLGLVALLAAWLAMVLAGFAHGVWFAMALPLAALLPVILATGAGRLALDRWTQRRMQRQQNALAVFQSPDMLARISADPDFLAQPVEREVAVLFIDLNGFTGLSERLGPKASRDLLRDWHALVEEGAASGGGYVASYMADGAMIVWGMAETGPDDALRAVRTAIRLQADTLAWLATVRTRAAHPDKLGVKVGGHLGPAVLSRLGHATHQHITAIGDTVNVASRLMKVAQGADVVMAFGATLVAAARAQGLSGADDRFGGPLQAPIRGRGEALAICLWPAPGNAGPMSEIDPRRSPRG